MRTSATDKKSLKSSCSPTQSQPSTPSPKFLQPKEERKVSALRPRQMVNLACPCCGEVIFELASVYVNHGLEIGADYLQTSRGRIRLQPMQKLILLPIVEAFPNYVQSKDLIILYGDTTRTPQSENLHKAVYAQISKLRRPLARLGLTLQNGYGCYKLEFLP